MNQTVFLLGIIFIGLGNASAQETPVSVLFKELGSEAGILFSNDLIEDHENNSFRYEYFYNGGGVSIGDINNDGLPDIYFTGNMVEDQLYLNQGGLKFENISDKAILSGQDGWHTGTTMADVNGDGLLDIYVCRGGDPKHYPDATNLLYINNGNSTFTEQAHEYGLDDTLNSTQAAFFDFDLDGDLDVYVMNVPDELFTFSNQQYRELFESGKNSSDHFYRNDNGRFIEVAKEIGINNHAFGLGLSIGDIDNNGWPDIYVANDYEDRDYMFMNNGGIFKEELKLRTHHVSNFGMGVDIADYNNDGHQDILEMDMAFTTHERSKRNMASMSNEKFWGMVSRGNHFQYMVNTLQLNNGNATFSEIGQLAGISKTDWSWGALFADFDNDGLKDIVVTNGQHRDLKDRDFRNDLNQRIEAGEKMTIDQVLSLTSTSKQSNYIFRNKADLTFESYAKNWGFDKKVNSNGVAYADLDNDGDIDLVLNNLAEQSSIYENTTDGSKNYLVLELSGPMANTHAIGAKVTLYTENGIQVQELYPTRGYQSSVDPKLYFGLGLEPKIDKIEIQWPDNKISVLTSVEINQKHLVDYNTSTFLMVEKEKQKHLFTDITASIPINHFHVENRFNDFERELLLPHALSQQGPSLAVGDINNDGLDDVFIGSSKGEIANIFKQTAVGFSPVKSNALIADSLSEDIGALFFDFDGDGDEDLYVASGGNEFEENALELQDRLYANDGKGNFSKLVGALPKMISSTKVIRSADFDEDGDLDLFVGGRLVPGKYPVAPRSYLLKNENGKFVDITTELCKDLLNPGMINGAEFVDVNGDGKLDLTLIGEWMGLTTYLNEEGSFVKKEVKEETEGLWFSLLAADIDKDGDIDFVGGNLGKNAKFKASIEKPFNVYGNDFDENGTFDLVLSSYEGDVHYPVRGRECSSQQMPFIADVCPTYKDFAQADMIALYGDKLNTSVHLTARNLHSCVFLNDGVGNFEMKKLPNEAQFSPIQGIIAEDINKDGKMDIIAAGNMYEAEVETVRYDAGRGVCLLGDGRGNFTALSPEQSGFFAWNNVKSMVRLMLGKKIAYLLGVNQSYPQIFLLD
jgi:hypothetical protein